MFIGNYLKENGQWRRYYTLSSFTMVHSHWLTFEQKRTGFNRRKGNDPFGIN
jgi:hypothetical protein